MGKVHHVITKIHRICAGGLLLSMIPASWFALVVKDQESFFIYLPLLFLFPLIITGTYQLVLPWIHKRRARRMSQGPSS